MPHDSTPSPVSMAFSPALGESIRAGDHAALLLGLAALARLWQVQAGFARPSRAGLARTHCVAVEPARGALLAASLDLFDVLELSPQGREVVANLARQPLFDEPKGE